MSYLLPHLHSGYAVDQAILGEEERVVVIRFGHDWDPQVRACCCVLQRAPLLFQHRPRWQRVMLLASCCCVCSMS